MGCPCVFATLRTVGISDTLYRAYHSGCMKKTGKQSRFSLPVPAIYAMQRSSQPPDPRTYSAEVTSFRSNLPHHRRLRAPIARLTIILQLVTKVNSFLERETVKFLTKFTKKSVPTWGLCRDRRPRLFASIRGKRTCKPGPRMLSYIIWYLQYNYNAYVVFLL